MKRQKQNEINFSALFNWLRCSLRLIYLNAKLRAVLDIFKYVDLPEIIPLFDFAKANKNKRKKKKQN